MARDQSGSERSATSAGGTITHHHAVGRLHRPWYDHERSPTFGTALAAVKHALDPSGIARSRRVALDHQVDVVDAAVAVRGGADDVRCAIHALRDAR